MLKNILVKLVMLMAACVAVALSTNTQAQELIFKVRGLNLLSYIALAAAIVMLMVVKVADTKKQQAE